MKILGAPVSVGKISFDDVPINMDICYNNLKKEFIVPEEGFYIFMSDVTLMRPVGVLMFSCLECNMNGFRKYNFYDIEGNNRGKGKHMSAICSFNLKENDIVTLTNGKEGSICIAADQPFYYMAIYVPLGFQRYLMSILIVPLGFIAVILNIGIFDIS